MEGAAVKIDFVKNSVADQVGQFLFAWLLLFMGTMSAWAEPMPETPSARSLIVVVGAPGNPQYEIQFYQWAERWEAAAVQAGVTTTVIGRHRGETRMEVADRELLKQALLRASDESVEELWVILIGHGTFDRRVAKFNLRGDDVSAVELADWLKPVRCPTAIINCASASGPFIPALSAPNRIVVTATKSGTEVNFTRFGDFLSRAIVDPAADLDKDQQTSLWEAFLIASRHTLEYYDTDGRLATEHALLDDNGDQQGVRADQFRGLTPIAQPTDGRPLDNRKAHQWHLVYNATDSKILAEVRAQRNVLELAIDQLRDRKGQLPETQYISDLERLLIELAELNERIEQSN